MHPRSIPTLALLLAASALPSAAAHVEVDSRSGPWQWTPNGVNSAYQYGVGDHLDPAGFCRPQDLSFPPWQTITVTYLSGLVNPYGGPCPGPFCTDASGSGAFNDNPGSSGRIAPSFYIPHSEYDAGLMALIGVFLDGGGQILGAPHKIGNGPTSLAAPSGAAFFQLGFNDDIFSDNTGSVLVDVEIEHCVPEPSTFLPCLLIALSALAYRRRPSR